MYLCTVSVEVADVVEGEVSVYGAKGRDDRDILFISTKILLMSSERTRLVWRCHCVPAYVRSHL